MQPPLLTSTGGRYPLTGGMPAQRERDRAREGTASGSFSAPSEPNSVASVEERPMSAQEKLSMWCMDDSGDIERNISNTNSWYCGDFINMLMMDFDTEHIAVLLSNTSLKQEDIDQHEKRFVFIPLNVPYEGKGKADNENHWIAIIVDVVDQKIFCLDPAAKIGSADSLPKDIKNLIHDNKYDVIFNTTDFQISEKEGEYGLIHCGPYTVQIFEEFKKCIENGKTVTGENTDNKQEITITALLSAISPASGDEEDDNRAVNQIRKHHQDFALTKKRILSSGINLTTGSAVKGSISKEKDNSTPPSATEERLTLSDSSPELDKKIVSELKMFLDKENFPETKLVIAKFNKLTDAGKKNILTYYVNHKDGKTSLFYAGVFYRTLKELNQAIAYWEKAAELGNEKAMCALGIMHHKAMPVKNLEKAKDWYVKAVNGNNITALLHLGNLCSDENKISEAKTWWEKAAESGNEVAMYSLSVLCEKEDQIAAAAKWLQKATEAKDSNAINKMSKIYSEEQKLENIDKTTIQWWQCGAMVRNHQAMFNLGRLSYKENKLSDAKTYWKEAAAGGNNKAMFALSFLYQQSDQLKEAKEWWERATEDWDDNAAGNLKCVQKQYQLVNQEWWANTIKWWEKPANMGDDKAMFVLGCIYESKFLNGNQWWERSAIAGNNKAMFALGCWNKAQAEQLIPAEECGLNDGTKGEEYRKVAEEWFQKAVEASHPGAIARMDRNKRESEEILKAFKVVGDEQFNRELTRELISDDITQKDHTSGGGLKQEDNVEHLSLALQDKLFHPKIPSAFKVTDVPLAQNLFSNAVKKGWRWVAPDWLPKEVPGFSDEISEIPDKKDPVTIAKQMPALSLHDWVILEGKTMRLLKATSEDKTERGWREKLEKELKSRDELSDAIEEIEGSRLMATLYPEELPLNFFEESYGRLAGAYIRHVERLPKLHEAFHRFFELTECPVPLFKAGLFNHERGFDASSMKFRKWAFVKLINDPIRKTDLVLLRQALGIVIDAEALTEHSTIENTIPFKKVVEMLTCFDPIKYTDCPWYISFNILEEKKDFFFLLSRGQYETTKAQLLLSTLRTKDGDVLRDSYVGNAYSHWMSSNNTAEIVLSILSKPISEAREFIAQSADLNADWSNIMEFIICTHVVEAHCTLGLLQNSRVPGSGKQTRAILNYHLKENLPLSLSFDVKQSVLARKFPMAGEGGTGKTRTAVNELVKPAGKAPVYDMSEDSEVEELREGSTISGEGRGS